jgi:hypothetical protein
MSSMELPRPLPDPKLKNSKLSRSNSQLAGLPKKMSFLRRLGSRATKNTYVKPEERRLPAVAKGQFGLNSRGGIFEENDWDPLPRPGSPTRKFNPMNSHFSMPPEGGLFPKINLSATAAAVGGSMFDEGRKVAAAAAAQQQQHMAAANTSQEIYYGANKVAGSGNNNNNNNSKMAAVANNSGSSRSGSEGAKDKRYSFFFYS